MRNHSILVRVPATAGNVAGAQDYAALALDASLNVKVTRKSDGCLNIRYFGENGEQVPRDRANLIARAFESALRYRNLDFTGADFEAYSTIPVGFGLGSSAAAVWAGLVSANLLYDLGLDEPELFDLARLFEPRLANLHAAWKGGLAVAARAGAPLERTRVSPEFALVAVVLRQKASAGPAAPLPAAPEAADACRRAADVAAHLARPDAAQPDFAPAGPGREEISAIAKTLDGIGCVRAAAFVCGGGPALGFLVRGLTPESALNVQETLIRGGLARKMWSFRPANSGAEEWNEAATFAPAAEAVGEEMDLARAAHTAA